VTGTDVAAGTGGGITGPMGSVGGGPCRRGISPYKDHDRRRVHPATSDSATGFSRVLKPVRDIGPAVPGRCMTVPPWPMPRWRELAKNRSTRRLRLHFEANTFE